MVLQSLPLPPKDKLKNMTWMEIGDSFRADPYGFAGSIPYGARKKIHLKGKLNNCALPELDHDIEVMYVHHQKHTYTQMYFQFCPEYMITTPNYMRNTSLSGESVDLVMSKTRTSVPDDGFYGSPLYALLGGEHPFKVEEGTIRACFPEDLRNAMAQGHLGSDSYYTTEGTHASCSFPHSYLWIPSVFNIFGNTVSDSSSNGNGNVTTNEWYGYYKERIKSNGEFDFSDKFQSFTYPEQNNRNNYSLVWLRTQTSITRPYFGQLYVSNRDSQGISRGTFGLANNNALSLGILPVFAIQ